MNDPRNPELAVGRTLHGYRVLEVEEIHALRACCWTLVHEATGARHAHISHELEENAFLLSLRTIPPDSTGVAHILEHGVLEGSRRYPVKMFNELTGRSLHSFLNAFTGPDRTAYPFATPSAEDWDNLLTRYLDAAFDPLLEKEAFLQEGWRLEFAEPDDPSTPLVVRGVVYNEMKAALSSPEALFSRRFRRELLPALCYRHESGGDPEAIPDLSYEQWRAFHRRHYTPANSWTATFGNLPLAATLKRMDECFRRVPAGEPVPWPGVQPPLGAPRSARLTYPVLGDGQGLPRFTAVGWRLCPQTDLETVLRLGFLFDVLIGGLAAPLNHALLQSGLGPALAPVGFDGSFAQLTFGIGLRGVEPGAGPQVEAKVLEILRQLAEGGLDPGTVAAALDRYELEVREQQRVWGMPWGLALCYFGMPHWMAGGSFAETLRGDRWLESLRREAEDPDFLPGMIRRWLLDNPERLSLEVEPEPGAVEARERRLAERLEETRAGLDEEGRRELVEQARRVAAWRDDPGDLSCMPELDPGALPRMSRRFAFRQSPLPGGRLLAADQPVNGLAHLQLYFPLDVADPDLPLVDLLGWLARLGHGGLDVQAAERRLRSLTGGISLGSHHSLAASGDGAVHCFAVSLHGLARRSADWLALLDDLLRRPALDDRQRLGELLRMRQSSLRSQLVSSASNVAQQAALDRVSPLGRIQDRVEGVGFLRLLNRLDASDGELGARLKALLERVLASEGRLAALCAEGEDLAAAERGLAGLLAEHPVAARPRTTLEGPLEADPAIVQLYSVEVDGAFVAECWPAPGLDDPDAARLTLLAAWMRQPLYERIRAAGGAYGANASLDWSQRGFTFLSWRDPRLAGTYADYDAVRLQALDGAVDAEGLHRARVEALRRQDTPLLPHEKASRGARHILHGSTPELRDAFRATLLDASAQDLADAAGRWLADPARRRRAAVCAGAWLDETRLGSLDVAVEEVLPA